MPIQTLGIFDKVFDWVYDKLLSPVIDWFAKIISAAFEWVFDNILMGFLKKVFEWLWEYIGVEIANFFFAQIYAWYCGLLKLVDIVQYGFDVLIGLQDITYINEAGQEQSMTLLNYIIFNDAIRTTLVAVTFIALALTIMFAIYSVIQSSFDLDFENKRPVGKVMTMTLKAMMTFLFIPLIVWVGLNLASVVLKQTAAALSGSVESATSISDTILLVSAMDAHKDSGVRFSFNTAPWSGIVDGSLNYITFAGRINIAEIDYLVGFASAIFCLIIMIICLFSFIRRIYDIVLLYIVSPYFASTMVLDDGQKFAHWRETFIAKVLVGFGSALGMRLFLLLIPVVMSDDIQFFSNSAVEATAGYVLKLLFILGGMYAVYKSSSLLTSIISTSVAQEEQMNNAMMMHGIMAGGKKLGGLAVGALMKKPETTSGGNVAGAAGKTGNKQPIPESPSLPSDAIKIDGAKGATKEQSEAWKKKFGGLEIIEDYEQKPNMHIADVEDMSDDLNSLFKLEDPAQDGIGGMLGDTSPADKGVFEAENVSDISDMSEAMHNLFDNPNVADAADISEEMSNLFDTPNVADAEDVSEELGNLFNPENHAAIDTPNTMDVEDMSEALGNLFDDSTRRKNGFAGMRVGNEQFWLPRDYTAIPKLVPNSKLQSRVAQMKAKGEARFAGYYDAVAAGIGAGSYSIPKITNASESFHGITAVGSSSMHVPKGYTVVPEIMKTMDAAIEANNFRGGKNQEFYAAFAQAVIAKDYSTITDEVKSMKSVSSEGSTLAQQAVRPRGSAPAQMQQRPNFQQGGNAPYSHSTTTQHSATSAPSVSNSYTGGTTAQHSATSAPSVSNSYTGGTTAQHSATSAPSVNKTYSGGVPTGVAPAHSEAIPISKPSAPPKPPKNFSTSAYIEELEKSLDIKIK